MPAITITDLANAKLDVDHITAIATSVELTATDRLGHIKSTLSAAIDSIKSFTERGDWSPLTLYAGKDLVKESGTWYVCLVPHTSSAAFATDKAIKWQVHQGVIASELAAPTGASLVGANAYQTQDDVNNERVSSKRFGAVGDGIADDTAKFALLEATNKNMFIDLLGKVYSVSAEPAANFYYNGGFIVSGVRKQLPGSADSWHYDPLILASSNTSNVKSAPIGAFVNAGYDFAKTLRFSEANTRNTRHIGLTSAAFETADGKFNLLARESFAHANDTTGKIVLYSSSIGGRNFAITTTTALDTASVDDRDFAFGIMDSGRIGAVVSRLFAGLPPVFIYSDDNGATWATIAMAGASNNFGSWFGLHKHPTSAGGADSGGWICYGSIEGVWDGIRYCKTVDNGATWTTGIALAAASVQQGSEPTICRIGDANKWVMIYRDNTVLRGVGRISFSDDLITWSAPQALGFVLGKNPPYLFYKDGFVYLFASMRSGGLSEIHDQNKLIYMRTQAYKLLAGDHSDFVDSNMSPIASFDKLLGYFTLNKCLDGSHVGSLVFGERDDEFGDPSITQISRVCLVSDIEAVDTLTARKTASYAVGGKTWGFVLDKAAGRIKQSGSDLTLGFVGGTLQATITFPVTFDSTSSLTVIPVLKTTIGLVGSTVDKLGIFRVDLVTTTSCRVTLFNTSGTLTAGSAEIDVVVDGIKTINDV